MLSWYIWKCVDTWQQEIPGIDPNYPWPREYFGIVDSTSWWKNHWDPTISFCRIWGVRVTISTQFAALKGVCGSEWFLRFHPVSSGLRHESLECISIANTVMSTCPRPRPLLQWSQTPRDVSRFNFPPSFCTSDLEESCICVPAATKRPSLIASQCKAETSHFLTQHTRSPHIQVQHGRLVFYEYCPPPTQPLHWQRGAFQINLILWRDNGVVAFFFFWLEKWA